MNECIYVCSFPYMVPSMDVCSSLDEQSHFNIRITVRTYIYTYTYMTVSVGSVLGLDIRPIVQEDLHDLEMALLSRIVPPHPNRDIETELLSQSNTWKRNIKIRYTHANNFLQCSHTNPIYTYIHTMKNKIIYPQSNIL